MLAEALGLWRDSALADIRSSPRIQAETERLEELRVTAISLNSQAASILERS